MKIIAFQVIGVVSLAYNIIHRKVIGIYLNIIQITSAVLQCSMVSLRKCI